MKGVTRLGWIAAGLWILAPAPVPAEDREPDRLRDRGTGISTSMFGVYIDKGEFIVYPFFEYYLDSDLEYQPDELGYPGDTEYRGRYHATEELLFLGYGVSERLALELEGALIQASLERDPEDDSGVPARVEESGVGDIEGQLRWRWRRETSGGPEVFSYFETVFPTRETGSLIGTTDWEFKLGVGFIRGFSWGTGTVRLAGEYTAEEDKVEAGEIALEYLRRLSPRALVYAGVEGTQDEWELITELQWKLGGPATLKLNHAVGLTSKATDWAPEVGVLFRFGP
jgi:hypothetical protein